MSTTEEQLKGGPIQQRYYRLETERSPYLEDSYRASELTIQFLLPRNSNVKERTTANLKKQHQSLGAMGVSNISNKLLLTLFPPNQPFFKLGVDDFTAAELTNDDTARSKVEEGFSAVERTATDFVERSGIRPVVEEFLKHLIVCGNVLVHRLPTGGLEIFHMDQYVVNRDPDGLVREIIIEEFHTYASLPEEIQVLLEEPADDDKAKRDVLSMFTYIEKINQDTWKVTQEIKGIEVPTKGLNTFKDEDNPWFALRFHSIKGSSWGRSLVHNHLGDLDTLEQLWKSFTHASKAMAFLLFLIRPGSTITPKQIIEKINGGFISGQEGDVTVLQTNKGSDLQVVITAIDRISQRLMQAFLMDAPRDAERVTAEEIRLLAQRLEEALGGFYSILTQDFQLPFLELTLNDLISKKEIPPLPKGVVKPLIITGLDALGRNSEADRLRAFSQELQAAIGPEGAAGIMNTLDFARRLGAARGIDTKGLIKTQEQLDEEKAAAQQQAMTDNLAPHAIRAGAQLANGPVGEQAIANLSEQQQ